MIRGYLQCSVRAVGAAMMIVAGCSAETEAPTDCAVGSEGCACTSGGACDPGLSCYSNLCVDVTPGNDAEGGGDAAPGDGSSLGDGSRADGTESQDTARVDSTTMDAGGTETADALPSSDAIPDGLVDTSTGDGSGPDPGMGDGSSLDVGEPEAMGDGTSADADTFEDVGPDGGLTCEPAEEGLVGGSCTEVCTDDSTCLFEFSTLSDGTASTLGSVFGLLKATEDPEHPGEYLTDGALDDTPFSFMPGGLCSGGCSNWGGSSGPCGECLECDREIGPHGWGEPFTVGIDVSLLFGLYEIDDADGVCRLKCSYDPTGTTNGGCPSGYTCSPRSEACVEACVNDQQCNLFYGLSRSEGLVTAFRNDQVCNPISGGCEPQTPATAKLNDPCVYHTDCPAPGLCISGFCGSLHCAGVNPAPCDGTCLAFGGSGSGSATVCVASCDTVDDCAAGQICVPPNTTADPSPGYCLGVCNQDDECRPEERCLAPYGVEPDPLVISPGQCTAICPLPGDVSPPEATPCGSNEACVPVEGQTYGRCKVLDALCLGDAFCAPSQACEVLGTDLRGRCVNGCTVDGDCAVATDVCVIQPGSLVGVCRSPGGVCSASPLIGGDTPLQPLLGDAQCVPGEQCAQVQATVPRTPSTCM